MKFESFKRKNNFRFVECECCAFCKWFEGDSYDFGGKCRHEDITGDNERYFASVYDFNICDKFEKEVKHESIRP